MKKFLAVSLAAILLCGCGNPGYTLFEDGRSDYSIVVAEDASASEKWAAEELQKYIREIGGATLPIVSEAPDGPKVVLGHNGLLAAALPEVEAQDFEDESFTYRSEGADIYIYGGAHRGTMYGVFTFLEKELGVRWYSDIFTKVDKRDSWAFDRLYDNEAPAFRLRLPPAPFFHDPVWSAHAKVNGTQSLTEDTGSEAYGGREIYWGCHSSVSFISPDEYYDEHPEYFSLVDGKRLRSGTQLCLSNPDVLKIAIEKMRSFMREHPEALIYDFSQADRFNPCQCDSCKALKARFGGQESGNWIWFVNQIADAVKDEFPDKYIGTFAYQYGRTPPENIVPRDNVVVRLCSIECCFVHPLTDPDCPENAAYYKDLKRWGEIAPHLYIWDYTTDYSQYMGTLPNYYVLQDNMKAFRDNHAIGVKEQGAYQTRGSEFGELKCYLLTKLLWNPDCDVQAVIDDFISGYFGSASRYVHKWFDLCASLADKGLHMTIYEDHNHEVYSDDYIDAGLELYKKAVAHCKDGQDYLDRVECAFLPAMYLLSVKHPERALEWLDTMRRIVRNSGVVTFSENGNGAYQEPEELFDMVEKVGREKLRPIMPPAMGWRSEFLAADGLTPAFVGAQADALVASGLADAGYRRVSVGAGAVGRGGFADVADAIHAKGMQTEIIVGSLDGEASPLADEWGYESVCLDSRGYPGTWSRDAADSWTVSEDGFSNDWESLRRAIEKDIYLSAYAGKSHYNDLGLLAAGRAGCSLSEVEKETQFTMYCALASPLFLGCDLSQLSADELKLVTNKELIAVNQDLLGLQSELVKASGGTFVLAKDLKTEYGLERAVALYNPTDKEQTVSVTGEELCLGGQLCVRDLNHGKNLGKSETIELTLPAHGARLLAVKGRSRLERKIYEGECGYCIDYNELDGRGGSVISLDAASCGAARDGIGYTLTGVLYFNGVMSDEERVRKVTLTIFPGDAGHLMISVNGNKITVDYPASDGATPVDLTVEAKLLKRENIICVGYPAEPIPPIDKLTIE